MYWYYDDPEVAFYSNILAGEGAAVVFTLPDNVQLVTGLIRNYEDQSTPPNKDFMFHVWTAGANGPEDDMITPFSVTPAATPANPNPMTVVDLRDYVEELSGISGDVFIGMIAPEDTVKITMATLFANRSFALSGGSWGPAAYDFHFRLVTTSPSTGISPIDQSELFALVFPNPATDILYIESKVGDIGNIQVVNAKGQIVYSDKVNTEKTQIKISNLNPGVYFVKVETVKGIKTKKIIVE
jgi:hypothetical protein